MRSDRVAADLVGLSVPGEVQAVLDLLKVEPLLFQRLESSLARAVLAR